MRQRLKQAGRALSPDAALHDLRRIQHHRVSINGAQPVTGVSSVSREQTAVLACRVARDRM